ncbi:phage portal protein [Kaistia sp. UC242_56]|uniref:phage portal protein n=1 Tax=Kaistia sp. UC242_56 TaxID=3374625 RepID=UPI003790A652
MHIPFLTRRPAAAEAKSLAAPDSELLALFGAAAGTAPISPAAALAVPAVSAAVRVISEAAATLDVRVVRVDGAEEIEEPTHPVAGLLRDAANTWTSGFEFIRDLTSEALTRDAGGIAWVNRVDGKPVEVIQYDPGTIDVSYARNREPTYRLNGEVIDPNDIVHLRGAFSRCPLSLASAAIGIAAEMGAHASKLFSNGARPSGVIEVPKALGDEGLKRMKAGWKAAHEGSANSGKTAILWDGATFRPITFSSTDAQFLETWKFQIVEIARHFRVPPSMLFDLDRATWSNSEQMGKEFLTYCLEPWLRSLEGALRRALFSPDDRKRYRIVFDRDDLTRADLGARATAYSSLIASRVLNPNEARRWEGLPAYAEGNAFTNPNITTAPASAPKPGDKT